jgi:arsenate reductase-like glutaredoxin family protein
MDQDNTENPWAENKKELNRKMREFRHVLSEFSRLFQRVNLKGDENQRAELKKIIQQTNSQIVELLRQIDQPRR